MSKNKSNELVPVTFNLSPQLARMVRAIAPFTGETSLDEWAEEVLQAALAADLCYMSDHLDELLAGPKQTAPKSRKAN